VSGVVDTDTYHSLINFPFMTTAADGVYTVQRGTPLVQIFPFQREQAALSGIVRAETRPETETKERILANTLASEGWYRRIARAQR
jgi:hypothetical protein